MAQAFYSGAFYDGAFEAGTPALVYTLDAQPASYSITGSPNAETVQYNLISNVSSYSITGNNSFSYFLETNIMHNL